MRRDPSCVRGLLTAWPQSLEFKYLTNQRRPTEDNMRGSSKSWQGKKMLQEKTSEGLKDRLKMKKQSENFPSSFNKFLQLHSKSKKASLHTKVNLEAFKARRECARSFWRFTSNLLDEEESSTSPSFNQETAETFFTNVYDSHPKQFSQPSWLPEPPAPITPFDEGSITLKEIEKVIKHSIRNPPPLAPLTRFPTQSWNTAPLCFLP